MGHIGRHSRRGRLAGTLLRTQPDERLVELARQGARAPFEEIARRHRPALLAYARSLAPASRAEDVVQESLLKAYAALLAGAEPELIRAWLFRIARNTAIDEHRGVRHHEQLDENYDGVEQPPQALDRRQRIAALIAAIRDLPPAQRDAIVQRELEGRSHDEIARALSVSSGAVRQLIYRARHSLRDAAGALIPAALIRAASIPGAGESAGGLGVAGGLKLGLGAIVATGTIVAGASIERGGDPGTAEALQLSRPSAGRAVGPAQVATGDAGPDRTRRTADETGSGPSRESGRHMTGEDHGSSGSGSSLGGSDHSGSSGDGTSSNSGPGSSSSGPDSLSSGDGSGTSGDGGGTSGGGSSDGGSLLPSLDGSSSSDGPG